MRIIADYHWHTPLCQHATGPLEAYIERAIELGLRTVGFSDHNPLPDGLGANVRMREAELDYYVNRVRDLQFQYHGQIDVRLGLEMDYLEDREDYLARQTSQYPWDYVLGSIHYLDPSCRVGAWSRQTVTDVVAHYARYYELLRKLARSGLCDVIAHFDVAKRCGLPPAAATALAATRTLEEIAQNDLCLEINTSGYRHAELPQPAPYPSLALVEQALALGIPLMVNSDAHNPEQVGHNFPEIERFLVGKGCRRLATYAQRQREFYEL